jgi:3-dehydroquinate dehydratase
MIAPACIGTISGFGWYSYALALQALKNLLEKSQVELPEQE